MTQMTLKQAWGLEVHRIREYLLKLHKEGRLDRDTEKRFVRQELLRIAEETE